MQGKHKSQRHYSLYKGDLHLASGTISQIAAATGKSRAFIYWLTCPIAKRRVVEREAKTRRPTRGNLIMVFEAVLQVEKMEANHK